jgi:hypothetical protein
MVLGCRFPQLIEAAGYGGMAGISTVMIVVFSVIPTLVLQWKGKSLHQGSS